jgi:hypothetical protein
LYAKNFHVKNIFVFIIILNLFNSFSQASEKSKKEEVKMYEEVARYLKKYHITLYNLLIKIEKEGSVKKSTMFDGQPEMWAILADDLDNVIDSAPEKVSIYLSIIQEQIYRILDPDIEAKEKINLLLEKNLLEEAANEYKLLNWEEAELKNLIQKKLDEKFGSDTIILYSNILEEYIIQNKDKLISFTKDNLVLNFDKNGNSSESDFSKLKAIPKRSFGTFEVVLNSQIQLSVNINDSLLVATKYSTSCSKPLFVDLNENFYFKTKNGLPKAIVSYDSNLSKKIVVIEKSYKSEKTINGFLIYSDEFKTYSNVVILKSDKK